MEVQEVIKVKFITAPKGLEQLEQLVNIWIAEERYKDKSLVVISVAPAVGITAVPVPSGQGLSIGGRSVQQIEVKTITAVAVSILYKIQVNKE